MRTLLFIPIAFFAAALIVGDLGAILSTWSGGRQTTSITLFGYPMLRWGRLGKILQFLAGLTVILDLIGSERLRTAEQRAHKRRNQVHLYRSKIMTIHRLLESKSSFRSEIMNASC